MVSKLKDRFISFIIEAGVLTFGDFVTKSGRNTPYFINTGKLNTGKKINVLGDFYAEHISQSFSEKPSVIFGPAYKGIPLAVATAEAYSRTVSDVFYSFDRKEEKSHGDKGVYVGKEPTDGDVLILVEDVITAGTTLNSVIPKLRSIQGLTIAGVVIAVDRCERGTGSLSAVNQAQTDLDVKIKPIITIHDIVSYLSKDSNNESRIKAIEIYLKEYGEKK